MGCEGDAYDVFYISSFLGMLVGRSIAFVLLYILASLMLVSLFFAALGKDGREGILGLVSENLLLVSFRLSVLPSASAK